MLLVERNGLFDEEGFSGPPELWIVDVETGEERRLVSGRAREPTGQRRVARGPLERGGVEQRLNEAPPQLGAKGAGDAFVPRSAGDDH